MIWFVAQVEDHVHINMNIRAGHRRSYNCRVSTVRLISIETVQFSIRFELVHSKQTGFSYRCSHCLWLAEVIVWTQQYGCSFHIPIQNSRMLTKEEDNKYRNFRIFLLTNDP